MREGNKYSWRVEFLERARGLGRLFLLAGRFVAENKAAWDLKSGSFPKNGSTVFGGPHS